MLVLVQQAVALISNVLSGIGVVLANKAVFTAAQFRFPVVLTVVHYAINLALLVLLACAGQVRWRSSESTDGLIHTTTAVWALHNAMSNLSLSRNSVGLYQISKILVTPMICALEWLLHGKVLPPMQALALGGACVGVLFATVSDVQFTALGAFTALASACASSVLKVMQQEVLQRHGWSSLELMYKTWGPQLLLLLLSVSVFDRSSLDALGAYEWTSERVSLLLLSATAAFALNVSSLVAISLTSAVAIVLLGQTKMMLTLLGGFLFFDAQPAPRMIAGAAVAICSIAAYTYSSVAAKASVPERRVSKVAASLLESDRSECADSEMEDEPLQKSAT